MKKSIFTSVIISTFLFLIVNGCNQKEDSDNSNLEFAKWQMYVLNFQDTFLLEKTGKKVLPIECDLKLSEIREDSGFKYYKFYFYYNDTNHRPYMPSGMDGLIFHNDKLYSFLISGMINVPFDNPDDSIRFTKRLNNKMDTLSPLFIKYLSQNRDRATPWLKEELKQRTKK